MKSRTQSNLEWLAGLMTEMFDVKDAVIAPETTHSDIEQWDSLGHLRLFMVIEERLGRRFTMEEITAVRSVSDILSLLESKNAEET